MVNMSVKKHNAWPLQRYKALGNAIALPCADYIMAGIYEVLADRAGKEE